jgi:endoglucanase
VRLLERLSNACAVSGNEGEVRKIVLEEVKPHADEVKVDALGNVLVTRRGQGENRSRVMLAAHMDEVGFMIVSDGGKGVYQFDVVGGLDARQLAGKPVVVGKKHTPGVIGLKPIHLLKKGERDQKPSVENLRIDLSPGASNKVNPGEWATFAPNFTRLGRGANRSLLGKAMDDRVGVATLIELVKNPPSNVDLLAAFTVQEEIGLRGARVAAYAFDPDLSIALDCTPAYDLPHWEDEENTRYNTRLGAGPAIYVADRATLADPRLVRHLASSAEAAGIPYQFRQAGGGGTDAGAIHRTRAGIPSTSLSVPARYIHTPAAIIRLSDWRNCLTLAYTALLRLTPELLRGERA